MATTDKANIPCLIASYGGSGSTFLTQLLKNIPDSPYHLMHVHGVPEENFLGVPLYNKYTGHSEGPFSHHLELPRQSKVIVIYRCPAEAYLSRACYKHFMHIWSDTDRMETVFGDSVPSEKAFNQTWEEYRKSGKDILFLRDYLNRWQRYAASGNHEIAFVRYEKLKECWQQVLRFLELDTGHSETLGEFTARSRHVPAEVEEIFADLTEELSAWEPFEVFPKTAPSENCKDAEAPSQRPTLPNSVFTCIGIQAGASDALARVGLVVDAVRSNYEIDFALPEYRNYHSPELDFLDLFGIRDLYPGVQGVSSDLPQAEISLSDLIYGMLLHNNTLQDGVFYKIKADLYENDFRIQALKKHLNFEKRFSEELTYTPRSQVFPGKRDTVKATLHLRRQDICGGALFFDNDHPPVPRHLHASIHNRCLLSISEAVRELEHRLPEGTCVDVVIASDGVQSIRSRFAAYPHIVERLDGLMTEIFAPVVSQKLNIRVVDRIVGTGPDETLRTLDAMHASDLVVTRSSSFPNVICKIGGTTIVTSHPEVDTAGV